MDAGFPDPGFILNLVNVLAKNGMNLVNRITNFQPDPEDSRPEVRK